MVGTAFHLVGIIRYFAIAFKKIMKNKDINKVKEFHISDSNFSHVRSHKQ